MRIAGKYIGASAALRVGFMAFLASAVLTGGDPAHAEPDAEGLTAQEKLDAAARSAFARIDDLVTGSLPRDAAAAEAANPMTARFLGIKDNTGFPAIRVEAAAEPAAAATDHVGAVGSIPPRDDTVGASASGDVTASVGKAAAAMPAPQEAKAAKAVKRAPKKPAVNSRSAQAHDAPVPFRDRGPVAKAFRIFVKGIGFLPSRL